MIMSKAEDKALKEYPYKEGYDVELPYPSTYDENKDQREAYIKGYLQAEKDNSLTWEDISIIRKIMYDYNKQIRNEMAIPKEEEYCKEVLKRFLEQKGGKV